MPRSERVLLAVTGLALGGVPRLRPLYRALDGAASFLATRLARAYDAAELLRGREAGLAEVAAAVRRLGAGGRGRALDVFLNVHGGPEAVTLAGGEVTAAALAATLAGAAPAATPRLLYSTACHAAAHAPALRAAGFATCVGARSVNATGAFETPLFLALWSRGVPVERALRLADHPAARWPADTLARLLLGAIGEPGAVDSRKELAGARDLTIEQA